MQRDLFGAAQHSTVKHVAQLAASMLCEELQATACCVFVLDAEKSWLWRAGTAGGGLKLSDNEAPRGFSSDSISVVTAALDADETLVVPEIQKCPFFHVEIDSLDQTLLPANMLCTPLKHTTKDVHGEPVPSARGAMQLLNKLDGCAFTLNDIEYADMLAHTVATAMSTALVREGLTQSGNRMQEAANAQKNYTRQMDKGAPLAEIVDSMSRIFDVEECSLFLCGDDNKLLHRTSVDDQGVISELDVKLEKDHPRGLVAQCLETRQLISVEDATNCGAFNRKVDRAVLTGAPETRNLLTIPLRPDDTADIIGVLQIVNARHGRKFTLADEQLLSLMAHTAAASVVNGELLHNLRWSQSLALKLVTAACHFSGEVSPETVFEQTTRSAKELTGADEAFLFLLEDNGVKCCSFKLGCSSDGQELAHTVNIIDKHFALNDMPSWGLAGYSCIKRQVVRCRDPAKDPRYNNMVDSVLGFQPAGMLAVPILQAQTNADRIANSISKGLTEPSTGGKSKAALEILAQEEAYSLRPLGVIEVVRRKGSRNGAFADSDVQTLEAFAQLVAVAIQTARECAKRKEGEQYARGLQDLVQESSDLLLELNQRELMSKVSDMILKHSCADQVTLFAVAKSDMEEPENSRTLQLVGLDSNAQKLRQSACASRPNLDWPEGGLPLVGAKMGLGYVGGAAKEKKVHSTTSLNEDKKTVDASDTPVTGETAHSVLCIPFMDSCVPSEARGVMQLHRTSRDGFTQYDRDIATFLGVLLTVGCKNCDRFMPLDSCHKQSEVLKTTMHGLSMTAQHSYRNLPMQLIMRCQELFGVTDASLYIYQESDPSVLLRYSLFPNTDENAKTKMSPVTPLPLWGVAGQCVLEDKAIILNDIDLDRTIYDREIDCPNTLVSRRCLISCWSDCSVVCRPKGCVVRPCISQMEQPQWWGP